MIPYRKHVEILDPTSGDVFKTGTAIALLSSGLGVTSVIVEIESQKIDGVELISIGIGMCRFPRTQA